MWDHLRHQARFQAFKHKVVHIVFTAEDYGIRNGTSEHTASGADYHLEEHGEKLMKQHLPDMLAKLGIVHQDIVINFGDADEVARRDNVQLMKYCLPKHLPVDSGIWYAPGRVDRAYMSDWPVAGLAYSWGDPTFQSPTDFVAHGRGRSKLFLLGGMHMTHYLYLPFDLIKRLSTSDSSGVPEKWVKRLQNAQISELFEDEFNFIATDSKPQERSSLALLKLSVSSRTMPLEELYQTLPVYKDVVYLPWFLEANKERYPSWFGHADPRLFAHAHAGAQLVEEHQMQVKGPQKHNNGLDHRHTNEADHRQVIRMHQNNDDLRFAAQGQEPSKALMRQERNNPR